MYRIWGHFCTITNHKRIVMKLCFRCGLYKQGLLHDLSKYSWVEFSTGVKYFCGYRSPNGIERERYGYSKAWLHHKGRNKHHWEYWTELKDTCIPIRMPINYLIEMWCDRIAATKVYEKENFQNDSALKYFMRNYDKVIMHPQTKALLELMLRYCAEHGCEETITYIKNEVKPKGYTLLEGEADEAL